MTLTELKGFMSYLFVGEIEVRLCSEDFGYRIEIWENDEYELINPVTRQPTGRKGGDLSLPFTIRTDKNGIVGFISHPFNAINKANVSFVIYVCSLIDVKIEI